MVSRGGFRRTDVLPTTPSRGLEVPAGEGGRGEMRADAGPRGRHRRPSQELLRLVAPAAADNPVFAPGQVLRKKDLLSPARCSPPAPRGWPWVSTDP